MSKIVSIEYVYKKDKRIKNSIYIYILFLILLLIICLFIFYKNNF